MAIQSFGDAMTENFFLHGELPSKGCKWQNVSTIAARKLDYLDAAKEKRDLLSPPGNRFEHLKGDLLGFCSIRINDQWRIVFKWTDNGPTDVVVDDYH